MEQASLTNPHYMDTSRSRVLLYPGSIIFGKIEEGKGEDGVVLGSNGALIYPTDVILHTQNGPKLPKIALT